MITLSQGVLDTRNGLSGWTEDRQIGRRIGPGRMGCERGNPAGVVSVMVGH